MEKAQGHWGSVHAGQFSSYPDFILSIDRLILLNKKCVRC